MFYFMILLKRNQKECIILLPKTKRTKNKQNKIEKEKKIQQKEIERKLGKKMFGG